MARAAAATATKISPFRLTSLLRLQKDPQSALELFRNPIPNSRKPYRRSARAYDVIICKLGRAKRFADMEEILGEMARETRFDAKEVLLCHVISFYGRARKPAAALRIFDRIPSDFRCGPSIRSFNSLLSALLDCGDLDKIAELCRDLGSLHPPPNACTYNILMRACGSVHRAVELFDEMRGRGIDPTVPTFGTLIDALCNNSMLEEAFKLKEEMLKAYNVKPNVHIYTSLIKALCKSNRLEEALRLKEEITGLDSMVYTTIIRGLFRAGRKGEVVGVLEEMKQKGVKPDVATYNSMIAGFCDDGDFEAAFEAVEEMKRNGLKPNIVSYNTIMLGLCREGRWRDAVELFEEMPRRDCRPDGLSYKMVFEVLCDAKEFKEAKLILEEMMFKGYLPGKSSMEKYVEGLSGNVDWVMVMKVLCQLAGKRDEVLDVWELVISRILKESEIQKATEFMECLLLDFVES